MSFKEWLLTEKQVQVTQMDVKDLKDLIQTLFSKENFPQAYVEIDDWHLYSNKRQSVLNKNVDIWKLGTKLGLWKIKKLNKSPFEYDDDEDDRGPYHEVTMSNKGKNFIKEQKIKLKRY